MKKNIWNDAENNEKMEQKYKNKSIQQQMKITDPETFRNNIRKRFQQKIPNQTTCINLEKGIYNYAIKESDIRKIIKKWINEPFVQLYMDRLWTITINLSSELLLNQINNGEIVGQHVAFMTHQEIDPVHWKQLLDDKIKRDANKFSKTEASTDMFICKKCKSKRCTYYELQTRSADEPATIFITCLDCDKRWKM